MIHLMTILPGTSLLLQAQAICTHIGESVVCVSHAAVIIEYYPLQHEALATQ